MSLSLMPSPRTHASGLRVPLLAGVPLKARVLDRNGTAAKIARALMDAGVASARHWDGDVSRFIDAALQSWIRRHGGTEVDRRFDMCVSIDTDLVDGGEGAAEDRWFLSLQPSTASRVHLGPMIEWLEPVDAQLPRTILDAFYASGNLIHLYDHSRAQEYWEMRMDGLEEEEIAAMEVKPPELELPGVLRRRGLSAHAVAKRRRRWPRTVDECLDAAAEVVTLAKAFSRIQPRHDDDRAQFEEGTLPFLIVALSANDRVHAAFDDEAQWMAQSGSNEPAVFWAFEQTTPRAVRAAFEGLARALELLAAVVRLIDTLPGSSRDVIPVSQRAGGKSLMSVFSEHFDDDYVIEHVNIIDDEEAA